MNVSGGTKMVREGSRRKVRQSMQSRSPGARSKNHRCKIKIREKHIHFLASFHQPVNMQTRVIVGKYLKRIKYKERKIIAHIKLYSLVWFSLLVYRASLTRVYYPK